uniref:Putative F-box protein At1g65770 n=1 Tax=Rhizophora mucronata TaxID=61149 RepID=A0A2P2Q6A5_RHIMU
MSDKVYEWAHLPKELLEMIGKRLDSRIDVYRFRAVCSSWRSLVPPSYRQSPRTILKLPLPILADAYFSPVTICRVELADDDNPSSSLSSSPASSTTWLAKVEESTLGEMQLLVPLSNHQLRQSPGKLLKRVKKLDLLRFRLAELAKAYSLKLARGVSVFRINKVVLFPNFTLSDVNDYRLLAIYHEGKLGYWRSGDERWTLVDDKNFHYDDIIVYKGQFYVVDRCGTVYWINSSLNLIPYSPPLYGCGNQKNLVESCGDLYVVDRHLDRDPRTWHGDNHEHVHPNMNDEMYARFRIHRGCPAQTIDIKVYKLDEEWGKWVDVMSLGDQVFVLGNECCFSASAREFAGCEGNCIYFTDPDDQDTRGEISGRDTRVFKLSNRRIGKTVELPPRYFRIFWPQ